VIFLKKKKQLKNKMFIVLIFLLLLGNIYFGYQYYKAKNGVKNAIIPSLNDDYFTKQLFLVEYSKDAELKTESWLSDNNFANESSSSKILDVKRIGQNPVYPNGCEAAASVMLLDYYGFSISLNHFIDNFLPMRPVYEKGGKRFGPDPAKYYAGDPSSLTRGWGCFSPVIKSSISEVLNNDTYEVVDFSNISLSQLQDELPIIIWVTIDYQPVKEVYEWQDEINSKTYTYPKNSHTVVLVGFDEKNYYVNDSLQPEEILKIPKTSLEQSYDSLGRQALGIKKIK